MQHNKVGMKDNNTMDAAKEKASRLLEGEVVSTKMEKTIVVRVTRTFMHPVVKKTVKKMKKYKAHDVDGLAKEGDWVEIAECKPLSKTKHMVLNRVMRRAS
jgi:small subunit ribosomal protein S17